MLSAGTGVLSMPWTVDKDCTLVGCVFSKAAALTYDAAEVIASFSGPTVTAAKNTWIAAQAINGGIVFGIAITLLSGETISLVGSGGSSVVMYLIDT